jgi:hypothetical protein
MKRRLGNFTGYKSRGEAQKFSAEEREKVLMLESVAEISFSF